MTQKDIITNKQNLVEVFEDNEVEEALDDKNHRFLLHALFKGPLTVDEIQLAFKNSGNEKSDKTIYRYLNKLKKAGLVIEAGKRVFMDDDNQIKTQTLFSRVAKIIFTPYNKIEEHPELKRKSLTIINDILKERFNLRSDAKFDCLDDKVQNLTSLKNATIADFFENTKNQDLIQTVQTMDINELYPILDVVSWIILATEKPDVIKDLKECYT